MQVIGHSVKSQCSGICTLQKIQAAQKGRFSGTARSQNGDHITFVHFQVNPLEDFLTLKFLADALDFQHHDLHLPYPASFFSPLCCSHVRMVQKAR